MTNPWVALCLVCEFFCPTMPPFISSSSHHRSDRPVSPITNHSSRCRSLLLNAPSSKSWHICHQTKLSLIHRSVSSPQFPIYWIWKTTIFTSISSLSQKCFLCSLEVETFCRNRATHSNRDPSVESINNTARTTGLVNVTISIHNSSIVALDNQKCF